MSRLYGGDLGRCQGDIRAAHKGLPTIPTFYFTQLLAIALGLPPEEWGLDPGVERSAAFLQEHSSPAAPA